MILRKLTTADTDAVRRIMSGRSAAALHRADMTEKGAAEYIRRAADAFRSGTGVTLGIDLDGDMLGLITLRLTGPEGHLSYVLREDAWGLGRCTEAVALLPVPAGVTTLTAKYPHTLPASGRVLEKTGFTEVDRDDRFVHVSKTLRRSGDVSAWAWIP